TSTPMCFVVHIATTAREKTKSWKGTSRSSKTTTSFRCGLAATPSQLPVKALSLLLDDYVDVYDSMVWRETVEASPAEVHTGPSPRRSTTRLLSALHHLPAILL
ncbi:hypothetical protein ACJX0J_010786, partial [Zea mays]